MSQYPQVGWTWHPSVVIGFALWTIAYSLAVYLHRRQFPREKAFTAARQIAFHAGTLVGLLALVSPLDELGDRYLFSAHMVQHLLLMFVMPPLWLIGTPAWLVNSILPKSFLSVGKWVTRLPVALLIFAGVMIFWHVPALYTLAQDNEGVHIFEHLTFIGGALIGWWPAAGPSNSLLPKPAVPLRLLYHFMLAIPCTALAAVLTFSSAPLYPFYISSRLINALDDQHLGGLLMWVPTHMILLLGTGVTFFAWFKQENLQTG